MDLPLLLTECAKRKASDLHLKAGTKPILRIHGHLEVQDDLPLVDQEFVRRAVMTLLGEQLHREELITYETARDAATNPDDFDLKIKGILSTGEMTWEAERQAVPSATGERSERNSPFRKR